MDPLKTYFSAHWSTRVPISSFSPSCFSVRLKNIPHDSSLQIPTAFHILLDFEAYKPKNAFPYRKDHYTVIRNHIVQLEITLRAMELYPSSRNDIHRTTSYEASSRLTHCQLESAIIWHHISPLNRIIFFDQLLIIGRFLRVTLLINMRGYLRYFVYATRRRHFKVSSGAIFLSARFTRKV